MGVGSWRMSGALVWGLKLMFGVQIGLMEPKYSVQKMRQTEMEQRMVAQGEEAVVALEGR